VIVGCIWRKPVSSYAIGVLTGGFGEFVNSVNIAQITCGAQVCANALRPCSSFYLCLL